MRRTRAVIFCGLVAVGCRVKAPEPEGPVRREPLQTFTATAANVPNPLILGLMPVFDPDEILKRFTPLASHIGERLGAVVEIRLSKDYSSMVDLVASDQVHIAHLSPFTYVAAMEKNPSLKIIATNIAEGSSTYSGYIIARTDLKIRNIDGLRGLRFGFVDLRSASGYLYPYAFLLDRGFDPARDFSEVVMVGRHDTLIEQVIKGRIAAGATFSGALLNAEREGLDTEQVQIVAKTGRIPFDAWVTSNNLPPGARAKLRSVFLALSTRTREGRRILSPLKSINAFIAAEDSHYDPIRAVNKVVKRITQGADSRGTPGSHRADPD